MDRTIGNPVSWTAKTLGHIGAYLATMTGALSGAPGHTHPEVRPIGLAEVRTALRLGAQDFGAMRTDVIFLCMIYPVIGLAMGYLAFHDNMIHMIFPIVSGFALLGPAAGVGLYQMSRRREERGSATWADAFDVIEEPAFGAIVVLGLFLLALFLVWLLAANILYAAVMGSDVPLSLGAFVTSVLMTAKGSVLVLVGIPVGFVFAAVTLVVSVVSFPMLVERNIGLAEAVVTSCRVARTSPGAVAAWGLIVAAGLVIGAIPALLGLAVVLPILGHATWHLYRAAVVPPQNQLQSPRD